MTLMLRLDPAAPPLWRDAQTLQFGAAATATLTLPEPWHQRLLAELTRGIAEPALEVWAESVGVRPREVARFVANLGALVRREATGDAVPPPSVVVESAPGCSQSSLSRTIAFALEVAGWDVRWHEHDGADAAAQPSPHLVVLVADHALDQRRAHPHLRADRAHVPVVATGGGTVVGPLIVPGLTACAVCLDLHRRDADEAWPALVAQLIGAPESPTPADECLAAARELVRMLGPAAVWTLGAARPSSLGRSLSLHAGTAAAQEWTPHPECGCRMPSPVRRIRPETVRRQLAAETA